MDELKKEANPHPKPRSWRYECRLSWKHGKSAELAYSDPKPRLMTGGGPEFGGDPANITPADMLLAALSSCVMSTFISMAKRHNLEFSGYEDYADGEMSVVEGKLCFTQANLRPRLTIPHEEDRAKAEEMLRKACKDCAIGNSVNFPVNAEPQVIIA
jgi:organic hydroperoxide reductase OsmC/OhrA